MSQALEIAAASEYAAFISYSHADAKHGAWLHHQLESYRIPSGITPERATRRIGKVFRDRVDMSAASDLGAEIRRALETADALIVVCSPVSAKSRYVNEEVRYFKQIGKGGRIFAAIVAGEPNASIKAGFDSADECFPPALIFRLDEGGEVTTTPEPHEPLAADIRADKDGRTLGPLKLLAALLGVKLDELVRRDDVARRWRTRALAGAAIAFAGLAVAAVLFGLQARSEQQRAEQALQDVFVSRAWEHIEQGQLPRASLYALAGWRSDTRNAANRRAALASILNAAGNSRFLNVQSNDIGPGEAFFSSDSRRVYAQTSRYFKVWDAATGVVERTIGFHGVLHRGADERRALITGPRNFEVDLTTNTTGSPVSLPQGQTLTAVAWGDGWLVANKAEGEIVFWSTARPIALSRVPVPSEAHIFESRFSPNGAHFMLNYIDGDAPIAQVWSVATGRSVLRIAPYDGHSISAVVFSPDGGHLTAIEGNPDLRIWSLPSGALVRTLSGHTGAIAGATFSADGTSVLTASYDGTARAWSMASGVERAVLRGHTSGVRNVAMSASGERIATVGDDRTLRIWDAASGLQLRSMSGHTRAPTGVQFSPDGRWILTESTHGAGGTFDTVRLWDARFGAEMLTPARRMRRPADDPNLSSLHSSAVLSADGTRLLTSAHGESLAIVGPGREPVFLNVDVSTIDDMALSPRGDRAATADRQEALTVWNTETGERIASRRWTFIRAIAFSPNSEQVSMLDGSGHIVVWDIAADSVREFDSHESDEIAFSPDGAMIAGGGNMGSTTIWNVANPRARMLQGDGETVSTIEFSEDGSRLVTSGTYGGSILVFDTNSGDRILSLSSGNEDAVFHGFAFRGRDFLVSASEHELILWDLTARRALARLPWPEDTIVGVAMAPDGSAAIFATGDGGMWRWPIAAYAQSLADLTQRVCTHFLPPSRRGFRQPEAASDPLIEAVWFRRTSSGDVCE